MTTPPPLEGGAKNTSPSTSKEYEQNVSQHLLTIRATIIFTIAILVGLAAGILTFIAGMNAAQSVLAGGIAFGGALSLANTIIA